MTVPRQSSPAGMRCTLRLAGSPTSCCRSFQRRRIQRKIIYINREVPMISRAVALALAVAALFVAAVPSQADDYPSRTVTMIVPYPAGGPTDELARILAQYLTNSLKQTFVVENVTGGGTIIGTNKVVRAAPDGYTLLVHNLQISANVTLYKKLPFDTEKDLAPVIFVNQNPLVLVGRKSLDANSLPELLTLMKTKTLKAALPGFGATGHLATALVAQEDKAKVDMIPYR